MGRSLYRGGFVRFPSRVLNHRKSLLVLFPSLLIFTFLSLTSCKARIRPNTPVSEIESPAVMPLEAVAALGQLVPVGEVRKLAAPVSGFGGTPRIAELLIDEGDVVKMGQVIALFDNRPQILADIAALRSRLKILDSRISLQKREIIRYKKAASQGATPLVLVDEKRDDLLDLQGQHDYARAELLGLKADLSDTELRTPITGIVLRINAQVGERPGNDGVVEVGANKTMQALIEVYESDINRVKLGQQVILISENGGFKGTLKGMVSLISPQVRQRNVLATDPTGDADARIVEVRVTLDADSTSLVRNLTGMKVIARFQPS